MTGRRLPRYTLARLIDRALYLLNRSIERRLDAAAGPEED